MTAFVLGLPEHKVRVIAPDVGGGFGSKIFLYAEETALVWAAKQLNRSDQVDRRAQRGLPPTPRPRPRHPRRNGDGQGRQVPGDAGAHRRQHGRLPVDLRHRVPTILYATLLAGQYTTPQIYAKWTRCSPTPRRSMPTAAPAAPRPPTWSSAWSALRRGDGPDPDEIRKRNFITTVPVPDAGGAAPTTPATTTPAWTKAIEAGRRGRLRGPQGRQRRQGPEARHRLQQLHRGLRHGAVEHRRRPGRARRPVRGGEVRVHPTGSVTVFTGSHSHGQGHETTFAQVVAARLGIRWRTSSRARRHRPRALRHGHLRQPLAGGGRHGHREGARQDRSPRARRSPPT
jgi:carbon-monoxide dehydrogenase large subunit